MNTRCKYCGEEREDWQMTHWRDGRVRTICRSCSTKQNDSDYFKSRREYADAFDAGLLGQRPLITMHRWSKADVAEQQLACAYACSTVEMSEQDWDHLCAKTGGYRSVADYGKKAALERRALARQERVACTNTSRRRKN